MIEADRLVWESARRAVTMACARAGRRRDFSLLRLPFCLRLWARCACLSFRSARRKNLGEETLVPSESTANEVSPRSMPTSLSASGKRVASAAGAVWTPNGAKHRPDASLITVTLDGADGRSPDQRTSTA